MGWCSERMPDGFLWTQSVSFDLFGPVHLATMALLTVAGIWAIRKGRSRMRTRRRLRVAMVGFLISARLLDDVWFWRADLWSIDSHLPLHLCSVMVWVSVYGLLTGRRWAQVLMYFFGTAGAVQAVLTPSAAYGHWHLTYLTTMLTHGILVIGGLWTVLVEGYRPRRRDFVVAFGVFNAYAAALYPLNGLLGSNYMYVMGRPENASLLDAFPDWPWYIPLVEVVALGLFAVMYLPFRGGRSGQAPVRAAGTRRSSPSKG